MDKLYTALGLMSGTSLDGIDASILISDGENNIDIKRDYYEAYEGKFKRRLEEYIRNIETLEDIKKSQSEYNNLERKLTLKHSEISKKITNEYNNKVDLIGFHGQTIVHRPNEKYSIQMGDPNLLSQQLKNKVIYNFRKKDIENGGQGAPLSPIYHSKLSKILKISEPNIFLNIGGIANITYVNKNILKAQDIGPGNVLMDKYIKKLKNINYDNDGTIASKGKINFDIVNKYIEFEYYNLKNKHSLNREDFNFSFIRDLTFEDGLATLTYFTSRIISEFINKSYKENLNIILCGGGRKNKCLIDHLTKLINKKIIKIDEYNINGDFIESQAFAYLAIRSIMKKHISFQETTNVLSSCSGGELVDNS